jgi:hypothetical protein
VREEQEHVSKTKHEARCECTIVETFVSELLVFQVITHYLVEI